MLNALVQANRLRAAPGIPLPQRGLPWLLALPCGCCRGCWHCPAVGTASLCACAGTAVLGLCCVCLRCCCSLGQPERGWPGQLLPWTLSPLNISPEHLLLSIFSWAPSPLGTTATRARAAHCSGEGPWSVCTLWSVHAPWSECVHTPWSVCARPVVSV